MRKATQNTLMEETKWGVGFSLYIKETSRNMIYGPVQLEQ
jgi:hypothetical protein